MKDIVIVPTCGRRPEFLWLCADHIAANSPTDKEFWICEDVHKPSEQTYLSIQHAVRVLNAKLFRRTSRKNSCDNIWAALEDAYYTNARLIYFLEDDIFVTQDMFRWSEQAHSQFNPFVVCADNPWIQPSNDPLEVGISHSLFEPRAASISRKNLGEVLKDNHIYSGHPETVIQNYIIKNKKTVIFPVMPRAIDAGWYGENKSGSLSGTLDEKINIIRLALVDSSISNGFIKEFRNPIPRWSGKLYIGYDHRNQWESQYEAQARWGF